ATATAAATAAAATTAATAAGADRDVGVTAALETLGGHDLVVMVTQVHTSVRPRGEVVADGDGAAGPPLLPDAPVLLEGRGAGDGGGVGRGRLVAVGGSTGGSARAPGRPGRPERAPGVDAVVLRQRVRRPAVEGQVRVARRVEGAGVGHGPGRAGAPA